jgi:hypothetical protein
VDRHYSRDVLVVNRFEVVDDEPTLRASLEAALAVLAVQTGFEDGTLGRNLDEPDLWVLVTRWRDVGSYRRALSSYDVKVGVVPVLSRAVDEPSAYEVVEPGSLLNEAAARTLPDTR